jgi:hypothetical protein
MSRTNIWDKLPTCAGSADGESRIVISMAQLMTLIAGASGTPTVHRTGGAPDDGSPEGRSGEFLSNPPSLGRQEEDARLPLGTDTSNQDGVEFCQPGDYLEPRNARVVTQSSRLGQGPIRPAVHLMNIHPCAVITPSLGGTTNRFYLNDASHQRNMNSTSKRLAKLTSRTIRGLRWSDLEKQQLQELVSRHPSDSGLISWDTVHKEWCALVEQGHGLNPRTKDALSSSYQGLKKKSMLGSARCNLTYPEFVLSRLMHLRNKWIGMHPPQ